MIIEQKFHLNIERFSCGNLEALHRKTDENTPTRIIVMRLNF